jgi:hypothetical protein
MTVDPGAKKVTVDGLHMGRLLTEFADHLGTDEECQNWRLEIAPSS